MNTATYIWSITKTQEHEKNNQRLTAIQGRHGRKTFIRLRLALLHRNDIMVGFSIHRLQMIALFISMGAFQYLVCFHSMKRLGHSNNASHLITLLTAILALILFYGTSSKTTTSGISDQDRRGNSQKSERKTREVTRDGCNIYNIFILR